jgi:AraC-like DNA-binding protein
MNSALLNIADPQDFFNGRGTSNLPMPINLLLFVRHTKKMLQQEALQNRSHHRFVLIFNLETAGHVHVNNLTFSFGPGQALLVLPYQFHHFSHLSHSTLRWLFCTFELTPRTFLEPLRNRIITIETRTQNIVNELLTDWHADGSELQTELLQTSLLRLLISLKQDLLTSAPELSFESENNLLLSVNRLLSEWRGKPATAAGLADALNVSASHLRVRFRETAGIPLGSYIQNYRLNHAMALLRTTGLSVADVAEEAGFGSPQAFSRIFKKETGKPPRSYRYKK